MLVGQQELVPLPRMQKKLTSIVLALWLMATQSGWALNLHFCGNDLAEVSWAHTEQGCGMEATSTTDSPSLEKTSCCSDQTLLSSSEQPFKGGQQIEIPSVFTWHCLANTPLPDGVFSTGFKAEDPVLTGVPHGPPMPQQPKYLQFHQWVIYG